ncbi:ABC transporter permease [Ohtaekwangia koreensis]|uniref:Putative ABC transport system permease protein n=1 Tax=Ohtaekwangia koreensis TaxID=688867 RepID=A0A1T5IQ23_9BACT|nr:ABC transporter permease [Ohtaekwangia koreensis]SKC41284.1 putative ABC transport system permease protein [Ohtaekwangia koreensis]
MYTLRQIFESFRFAWRALKSNILRTVLSLLGVTVGIFAIIAVLTLVDSLEKNIKDSLNFIGTNVIYVDKWPWLADAEGEYRWWDFWRRPNSSYNEYKFLQENLKYSTNIAIYADKGRMTVKRDNNSISDVRLVGASEGYENIFTVNIDNGRYLTTDEIVGGRDVVIIGYEVSKTLFPNDDPIGKVVKIKNRKFTVIGTVKKEGQSFMGTPSNDYVTIVPYTAFRKLYQTGSGRWDEMESSIGIRGLESDLGLVELENEVRGVMRARRGLRPSDKDNFAINRPEALANIIGNLFDVVGIAGWIIGGFSILVGGFGIANIMFVSVKERTSVIGLQKSLGAKNYFILFQFLFEAIFLSLIGGLMGLFLVYLITFIPLGTLVVTLTVKNIVLGLAVSSAIGLISGIVPAAMAARLDPVIAIRAT